MLTSTEFKLPILGEDMKLSLDNSDSVETVVLLFKGVVDKIITEK